MDGAPVVSGLIESPVSESRPGAPCFSGNRRFFRRTHGVADSFVTALDDFAHGGEVVYTENGHDFEFAVGGLVHLAVFPDDEGGDGFSALDVGDVKALDAAGKLGKHKRVG